MNTIKYKMFCALVIGLVVSVAAWPAYVAVNFALGYFTGEGSLVDMWTLNPTSVFLDHFTQGYKSSAVIAASIGLVAAIDYLFIARSHYASIVAGVLIPIACIATAFVFYSEPMEFFAGFAWTGLALWLVYKIVELGSRIRRS